MSELAVTLLPLAQGRRPGVGEAAWSLAWLLIVVLGAFVIAGIIIYVVRARTLKTDTTHTNVPLTLAEVRRMHHDGEIDDEEMERLRGIVTAQTRKELVETSQEKEA